MRTIILLFSLLGFSAAYSQDLIVTHAGDQVQGKVISISETSIQFRMPGESATNTIGKPAVAHIRFASGRIEQISPRIQVETPDDWESVMFTSNPADVVGLRRLGEVKAKAGGIGTFRTAKGVDRKATQRLKKRAAELGAHIILVNYHESAGRRGFYYDEPESFQAGVAYGY